MKTDLAAFQHGRRPNGFSNSMALKELNLALVALSRFPRNKSPQIAPLAGFRILFAGIQAVLS
jgi:hypothetical protein